MENQDLPMAPIPNPKLVLNSVPDGFPEPEKDIVFDETESIDLENDDLPEGGVIVKTLYLSVDPYMRGRMRAPSGEASYIRSFSLAHRAFNRYEAQPQFVRVLNDTLDLPLSCYVGVAGMPGKTAYHGWREYSKAKQVIACAGSDEKVEYMRSSSIGAYVAFHYKTQDVLEVLNRDGGIDIYWDNVGGEILDSALAAAKVDARFISISLDGFIVSRLEPKHDGRFYQEIPKLVAEGMLKYWEQVFKGLENVGHAILAVQKRLNTAKAVVKVTD
ncbi:hypothetical protein NMY22_g8125 [Coprinellus aureogranulatus]|nr:hypothetical protein NMY22_g8125 [Coprinellus aureogranulatus]